MHPHVDEDVEEDRHVASVLLPTNAQFEEDWMGAYIESSSSMHRISVLLPTDVRAHSTEEEAPYALLERTNPRGNGVSPLRRWENLGGVAE